MLQNLRTGSLDTITPGEMSAMLHEHFHPDKFSALFRERYRGVKLLKLPRIVVTASGTSVNVVPPNNQNTGPESGYVWLVIRANFNSSALPDTATANLYVGSELSQFDAKVLVDSALPVNKAYYPSTRGLFIFPDEQIYGSITAATSGNQYSLQGLAIEVPFEMVGKLIGG